MQVSTTVNTKRKKKKDLTADIPILVKIFSIIFTTGLSALCIIPMWLTLSISFTDEFSLAADGYGFIPKVFSTKSYEYIFENGSMVWRAYGVTVLITVVGTILTLAVVSMFAYAISRQSFPWGYQLSFFAYFTTLFSGGMVSSYIVNTTMYNLRDNPLILILAGAVGAMNILIVRTYMRTSIPDSVIESAKIDGASEFRCFYQIVLPMAVPVLATIGLMRAVSLWNDWNTSYLYMPTNNAWAPIQLVLKKIEKNIEYLATNANNMTPEELERMQREMPSDGFRMGLTMMVAMPLVIAYPFFQKYFVKGITVGAVKG
ncbi:MAG: carbohydrate ABC transporter permease [Monoglobales bacterium]